MSKTRQLVDANETISSFFQTQNLVSGGGSSSSSSSSSSFVPPKPPQHLSRGVDEAFEDQEDFALPEPFSKPPTSSNGTNFEDLYLQTQRKYDEVQFSLFFFFLLLLLIFFFFIFFFSSSSYLFLPTSSLSPV